MPDTPLASNVTTDPDQGTQPNDIPADVNLPNDPPVDPVSLLN